MNEVVDKLGGVELSSSEGDKNISLHQSSEIFMFSSGENIKNLVVSHLDVSKRSSGEGFWEDMEAKPERQ